MNKFDMSTTVDLDTTQNHILDALALVEYCLKHPDSLKDKVRELSLVRTKLEEAQMWLHKMEFE